MYSKRDSLTSRYKITLDGLICRYNQSINQSINYIAAYNNKTSNGNVDQCWKVIVQWLFFQYFNADLSIIIDGGRKRELILPKFQGERAFTSSRTCPFRPKEVKAVYDSLPEEPMKGNTNETKQFFHSTRFWISARYPTLNRSCFIFRSREMLNKYIYFNKDC